jgi:hypothetical protein
VTGLATVTFSGFPGEFEWNVDHVHTGAHKKCSQIVPDCHRLALLRSGRSSSTVTCHASQTDEYLDLTGDVLHHVSLVASRAKPVAISSKREV